MSIISWLRVIAEAAGFAVFLFLLWATLWIAYLALNG